MLHFFLHNTTIKITPVSSVFFPDVCLQKDTRMAPKVRTKRGRPRVLPDEVDDVHVNIPSYLVTWAKQQPEGLSVTIRRLLLAAYRRDRAHRARDEA
jgi:hypothetical protein